MKQIDFFISNQRFQIIISDDTNKKESAKMSDKPKLIFKFRSVTTLKELVRLRDIVQNNQLYIPTIPQVNDPFEGKINVSFAKAGSFITHAKDIDFGPVSDRKEQTRLLSLSEDCFSPQLWAYYCNDYHGVCLCFKTDKTFSAIQRVSYPELIDEGEMISNPEPDEIYKLIRESLFRKQAGWKYEHEWRMVFQPELDKNGIEKNEALSKLVFGADEIVGVIVGDKLNKEEKKLIRDIVPDTIKMFEVHTGALSGKVKLHDFGYVYAGETREPDYITTVDELFDRINL